MTQAPGDSIETVPPKDAQRGGLWHAELALLASGQVARDVTIEADGGRLTAVTANTRPSPTATRLRGFIIPGLANAHSHAFHRALRGRTQTAAADFWSWRRAMYELVGKLDPSTYYDLARATYAEMALSGITAVGEFHYLHHPRGGGRYGNPNEMAEALVAAAGEVGIRITLIDACYLWGGMGRAPLEPAQLRFSDGTAEAWGERVDAFRPALHARVGAAIHSVRAVDSESMAVVANWASERQCSIHFHVSEQRAENEQCTQATGSTPTELIASAGVLGDEATAIHATHLTPTDVALLGNSGTCVCLCPTTERDLGDGIGPARALADAGSPIAVGSDMHAMIDLFEEARALELDQRLVAGRRGIHEPHDLLASATTVGMRSIGWDDAGLAPGGHADFVAVRLDSPRTAGADAKTAIAHTVFAATSADVTDLVVDGEAVVRDGVHLRVGDVGEAITAAIGALT